MEWLRVGWFILEGEIFKEEDSEDGASERALVRERYASGG